MSDNLQKILTLLEQIERFEDNVSWRMVAAIKTILIELDEQNKKLKNLESKKEVAWWG